MTMTLIPPSIADLGRTLSGHGLAEPMAEALQVTRLARHACEDEREDEDED